MWVLLLVPWVDVDDSRRRPPGPPPPPPALLDVSMRVSGIGVGGVGIVYLTYRCVDVDSGLRGEHGRGSSGDRVLLSSSECCRGRVFRCERRRGSRRGLASERGGGRHHESREEECVHEREARFGAPVTRHGARGRVRRVGRVGRVTRVGSAHVSLGSVPFRKSRGWDHERDEMINPSNARS